MPISEVYTIDRVHIALLQICQCRKYSMLHIHYTLGVRIQSKMCMYRIRHERINKLVTFSLI
jgi:hypothetical protein